MDALRAIPQLLESKVVEKGTTEEFLTLASSVLELSRQLLSLNQNDLPEGLGSSYGTFFKALCVSCDQHEDESLPRVVAAGSIIAVISHRKGLILPALEASPELVDRLREGLDRCASVGLEYAAPLLLALEGVAYYDAGKTLLVKAGGVAALARFLAGTGRSTPSHTLLRAALEALSNATIPAEALVQLPVDGPDGDAFLHVLLNALAPPASVPLVHAALGVVLNMARDSRARHRLIEAGACGAVAKTVSIPDSSVLKLALTTLLSVSRENISPESKGLRAETNMTLGKALASAMLLDAAGETLGQDVFNEQAIALNAGVERQDCEKQLSEVLSSLTEKKVEE